MFYGFDNKRVKPFLDGRLLLVPPNLVLPISTHKPNLPLKHQLPAGEAEG